MFPNLVGCHHCFQMREPSQGYVFCEDMEIHLIELPKFDKELKDLSDGYDQWIYLLRYAQELDPQNPPKELTLPAALVVLKELEVMAHTDQERILYEARQRAILDERSRHNYYIRQRDEGREQGLEQGLEQGRKEGREIGLQEGRREERDESRRKAKLAKEINSKRVKLGVPSLTFEQVLDLSEEQLRQMLNDLGTN